MQHQEQYLRELRRQGYIITRSLRTSHLKIYDPAGCLVGVHSGNGGSDHRSLANLKADIRRHVCSAGEKKREHEQRETSGDEGRPDKPGRNHPRDNRGYREQDERDQDQEAVRTTDSETRSQDHDYLRIGRKIT